LLKYDGAADDPSSSLMELLQGKYDAAADLGKWDRKALERQAER